MTGPASLSYLADPGFPAHGGQVKILSTSAGTSVSVRVVALQVFSGATPRMKYGYAFDFAAPDESWSVNLFPPLPSGDSDGRPPPLAVGEYQAYASLTADPSTYVGYVSLPTPPNARLVSFRVREVQQTAAGTFDRLALDFTATASPAYFSQPAASGSIRIGLDPAVPVARLSNLSTRLRVGSGDQSAIAGFVVGGTEKKTLVVRSLGPSLAAAGIAGPLADPAFELFDATGRRLLRATSGGGEPFSSPFVPTDWAGYYGLYPSDLHEVAAAVQLDPGAYTVVASPETGGPGVGLIEVYEFGQGNGSRPINISTRGAVGTGDDVMIAGFIVQSLQPKRVLVRALGPSLASAGVAGTLDNPRVELRNGAGQLLLENDDWRAGPQAAEVQSLGRAPGDEREAVIIATLPAGSYTAIVRGVGDTTGVALVEVYDLDSP